MYLILSLEWSTIPSLSIWRWEGYNKSIKDEIQQQNRNVDVGMVRELAG